MIKQCKNCGLNAHLHKSENGWYVQCTFCGRITDKYYNDPADAVKEWNKWADEVKE